MSKQKIIKMIEDQVSDAVDAINEWDDFIERHKLHFTDEEYAQLISQNDLSYEEAVLHEPTSADPVAA